MSDIKEQIAMLQDVEQVTDEFEAAYESRKDDPERWEAAKAAFQEKRTYWREVRDYAGGGDGVSPEPVKAKSAVNTNNDHEEEVK